VWKKGIVFICRNRIQLSTGFVLGNYVKREFANNYSDDQLENGKQESNFTWMENMAMCQQKHDDSLMMFKNPSYVWGNYEKYKCNF